MNREVQNGQEMLDKDEQAVSRLVAGLKHIEAPENFERRVMSKIAEGKPKRRSIFAFPAIGYAVPALLVLVIATYFAFRSGQTAPATPVPVSMASNVSQSQTAPSVASSPVEQTIAQSESPAEQPKIVDPKFAVKSRANANSNRGGGSYDTGQGQTRTPPPEGIDPNRRQSSNSNEVMMSTAIPVKEMLDTLGMSVEFENGWRVKSVTDNGAAQKSGIKVGDLVTSLDGRSIDASTTFNGGSIRSVTVSRDGKTVPLKLVFR